ncbi:MAG: hypothetical protein WD294_12555 [Phycisphaeraceae bacterium]
MTWFNRLCRNAGLTIHHIAKPVKDDKQKREINRMVEQRTVNRNITLRRTTIDEIEVRPDPEQHN